MSSLGSLMVDVQVTGARASNNNRASTVLRIFRRAVRLFGWPSRLRGDRGRENTKIALAMVMHRGLRRASFIWGTYVACILWRGWALMECSDLPAIHVLNDGGSSSASRSGIRGVRSSRDLRSAIISMRATLRTAGSFRRCS